MNKTLGDFIKQSRKALKLTTAELAINTQLSQGYISHIENNRKKPTSDVLKKLADVLNIKYDDLLELAGYRDLAKFERMKNNDMGYLEQVKTVEDAVEALNMLWSDTNENYKLVLERTDEPNSLHLENAIANTTKVYFDEHELTESDRKQALQMLKVLFSFKAK